MQVKARRLVLATFLTVITVGAATGCSVFERDLDDGGLPAYTAPPETPTLPAKAVSTDDSKAPGEAVEAATSGGNADYDDQVRIISLTSKDLGDRDLKVETKSAALKGVHLTGCSAVSPGADQVEAKRRVALIGDGSDGEQSLLVSDVIAYESPAAAKDAMQQWRDSWSELKVCPPGKNATMLGAGKLRQAEGETRGYCDDLPAEDCAQVTSSLSNGDDEKRYTFVVGQRDGNVLAILALQSRTKPSDERKAEVLALSKPLGQRLVDNV